MNSLFIGRFQPFHQGHKKLIETELEAGNSVVIALRDTKISKENPFTIKERKKRIRKIMKEWGDKVIIISIPDINKICYGRGVGYEIKKIKLDDKIESISATNIRKKL